MSSRRPPAPSPRGCRPAPRAATHPAERRSGPRRRGPDRTALLGVAALLALAVAAGAFLLLRGGAGDEAGPGAAARAYAAAWTRGDDAAAARVTDRPRPAVAALRRSREGLDDAPVRVRVADVRETGDAAATATLAVDWEVPGFGAFAYEVPVDLTRLRGGEADGEWRVRWTPQAVHPRLSAATRLGTVVDAPARAPILDREGRGLVRERPVVDVAVETDAVKDPGATATRLAGAIDEGLDAGDLAARIRRAPRGRFLPVITLRKPAFASVAAELRAISGVSLNETTRPLAPTPDFARALLGTVGPATAEQLEAADRDLRPGELVGQSGLSAAFDDRLAGTAGSRIVTRDVEVGDVVRTLERRRGTRPRAVRTTLDTDVQAAAETALTGVDANAALVAVQPSTGDVLAVANRPADSTYDRALTGRYPPGSTFKVVTTAALLRGGLDPSETVDCPATRVVEGKSFRNFEGSAAGAVPFATDFAQSCNTAFVSLADRLEPGTLTDVAKDFGLGRSADPGVAVADADVPPAEGAVSQAAMMIGQDRIVASPLAMAGVAATVADGRWRAPRVLAGDPEEAGPEVPEADRLRTLMRSVVTGGTGTALADLPGEPAGKSGTAEYGGGDPPPTHAWFIAYRGDLAVAVLVEGGSSGGEVAAPVAARFLSAL